MGQGVVPWDQQLRNVGRKARRRTASVLSAAVEQMVPMLDDVGGVYLRNARLAAAFVDFGGSPLPLREVMPRLTAKTLEHRAAFPQLWAATGRLLPTTHDQLSMADLVAALRAATSELSQIDAVHAAAAWRYLPDVVRPMLRLMGH